MRKLDTMKSIAIQTVTPIFLLIGAGLFSRKIGILRSGDERVLSVYVYYFAMPALIFVNLAEMELSEKTIRFILAGVSPVILSLIFYVLVAFLLKLSREKLFLLILSSVFGSFAFFGIPFIMFAFPTPQGEHLAILSVASIAPVSVAICITILELYKLGETAFCQSLKRVFINFSKNPLILSILAGFLASAFRITLPPPLSTFFHMLGKSTSVVAIFMLGIYLYGREYTRLADAFRLSLLRILFLPVLALFTTKLFNLSGLERTVLILMHSTPVAVSVMVLSDRYDFYKETLASLILISSIGGGIYLTLWLYLLGYQ